VDAPLAAAFAGSAAPGGRLLARDGGRDSSEPAERRLQHRRRGTTAANGALIVRYRPNAAKAGHLSAQILTFPYHLVAMPKSRCEGLKFEKIQQ